MGTAANDDDVVEVAGDADDIACCCCCTARRRLARRRRPGSAVKCRRSSAPTVVCSNVELAPLPSKSDRAASLIVIVPTLLSPIVVTGLAVILSLAIVTAPILLIFGRLIVVAVVVAASLSILAR